MNKLDQQFVLEINNPIVSDLKENIKNNVLAKKFRSKYQNEEIIYKELINIIKASAVIENFEKIAGKAMSVLRKIFKLIQWEDFSKIRIIDCSVKRMSFINCRFQESKMNNVKIIDCWFINCCLDYVKWENMISYEQRLFKSFHWISRLTVSPHGKILASLVYNKNSIIKRTENLSFWDFQSGEKISEIKISYSVNYEIISANLAIIQILVFNVISLWNIRLVKKLKSHYQLKFWVSYFTKLSFHQIFFITQGSESNKLCTIISGKILRKIPYNTISKIFEFQPNHFLEAYCHEKELYIWDYSKGKLLSKLDINTLDFTFSPISELLALTQENSNNIEWWDVRSRVMLKTIQSRYSSHIKFSIDGSIFSFCDSENINIFNVKTGEKIFVTYIGKQSSVDYLLMTENLILKSQKNSILLVDLLSRCPKKKDLIQYLFNQVIFFNDGKKLLIITRNNQTCIVDILSGQQTKKQYYKSSEFNMVAFQPNLNLVALKSKIDSQIIQLYDYQQEKILSSIQLKQNISSLAISQDLKLLAYGCQDWTIILQDFQTLKQPVILVGHNKEVKVIEFSPSTELLISGDKSKTVILWDINTGLVFKMFTNYDLTFSFSPSSKLLAVGERANAKILDIKNNMFQPQCYNQGSDYSYKKWKKIIFLNECILLTAATNSVYIWNIEKGILLKQLNQFDNEIFIDWTYSSKSQILTLLQKDCIYLYKFYFDKKIFKLFTQSSPILWINFNIKEQLLSYGYNNFVIIYNLKLKIIVWKHQIDLQNNCLTVSSSGNLIAYICKKFYIYLINLQPFQLINKFQGNKSQINSLEFSYDEKLLISGHENGELIIWDVQSGKKNKVLCKGFSIVQQVIFYKDNQQIISCHSDKTIHFWNIQKTQCHIGFYKHQNEILYIAINPEENIIAFGSQDFNVHLLDIERKIIIQEFQFHQNRVNVLAFSMDGKFLASGSDDSAICLVDIENKSLVDKIFNNGGKITSLVFINNHLDFVYGNEYGNVDLIQFTKQNIWCVKVIQNEPIGISSVNSSLKEAEIKSNRGYDITNCFC